MITSMSLIFLNQHVIGKFYDTNFSDNYEYEDNVNILRNQILLSLLDLIIQGVLVKH